MAVKIIAICAAVAVLLTLIVFAVRDCRAGTTIEFEVDVLNKVYEPESLHVESVVDHNGNPSTRLVVDPEQWHLIVEHDGRISQVAVTLDIWARCHEGRTAIVREVRGASGICYSWRVIAAGDAE